MEQMSTAEKIAAVLNGEAFHGEEFPDNVQAGTALRAIVELLDLKDRELVEAIVGRVLTSADPQMALYNLQRFMEAAPNPEEVRIAMKRSPDTVNALVTLMAGSQFLSDVLIAQPTLFSWLISHETLFAPRGPEYYEQGAAQAVEGITDRSDQRAALSRWRRQEYLRIGLRDLLRIADAEEVSRDISDLAEAIIDQAAQLIFDDLTKRFGVPTPEDSPLQKFEVVSWPTAATAEADTTSTGMCVLGMGKLGGRELNFSSDIDLVFIYEAEGETSGRMEGARRVAVISNHDFYTRMGEALIRFLSQRGPDGNLFRVDMRLRPEGMDGPLVRSLEALAVYLSTQARDWERLAYLKARVVSGPRRLAEKLYRIISEFVFASMDAQRIISEVQDLKVRIDREVINSDLYRREVKRGYGGIREIEFVISAMQIIHGYHHHALRVRNTFLAIQRLLETHILDGEAAQFYLRAYSFLRMVEHRLQMAQEAQTHTLPPFGSEFEGMARRCGFDNGEVFWREYRALADEVHRRFRDFFEHDVSSLEQAQKDVLTILDRNSSEEDAVAALSRRGIDDGAALRQIHALGYGTREVFVAAEGQRFFEQMLPSLLRMTVAAPFPGRVFSQLHSFALAIKGITYYYEVLAQHPDILKLLVTLFGTSEALSASFIAHPEFFDSLISTRVLNEKDEDGARRRERMGGVLAVKSPGRRMEMLRRAVKFEQIVVALKYLMRIESLEESLKRHSAVADDAVGLAVHLGVARLLAKWGGVDRVGDDEVRSLVAEVAERFSIMALGKFGGRELNFFGDLDVIFVYDGSRNVPSAGAGFYANKQEFYDAVVDALSAVLSDQVKGGRAYVLDARLRPHGQGGAMTAELASYREYIAETAGVWELQALTRARTVWGTDEFRNALKAQGRRRVGSLDGNAIWKEIAGMRLRIEESAEVDEGMIEVKRSAGGLLDVEFLIQYYTLTAGMPWGGGSENYFEVLGSERMLGRRGGAALRAGYAVLRAVENTIRLVTGSSASSVPKHGETARAIAVALNFGTADDLAEAVEEAKGVIRGVWLANSR